MIDELPQLDFLAQPSETLDPLHLELSDDEIVQTVRDNIATSTSYYKEKNFYARQLANKQAYLGRQPLPKASNKAKPYKENVIYEGIARQKAVELSRMPDLTVKPGDETPESKKTAEQLTGIVNHDTKQDDNRKLLGLAIKQEPIYFFSCIKAIWNPEKGAFGDYDFVSVHPDNIVWDHNVTDNDANKMRFVAEKARLMLKEVIMMFPDKEAEIKHEFGWEDSDETEEKKLASPVNLWEVWFHWYKLSEGQSERIDGTTWIYGNLCLKKMKNPYFDYQGKRKTFSKELQEKNAYSIDEIFGLLGTQDQNEEKVYNNYFQDPEKPYFFMVYENFGEHPVGETSRVEQVLEFQDSINLNGSVIQDMNIRSRGKDLFDTEAIDQKTLDSIDLYNVDQAIAINVPQGGSINNVHSRIEQSPATAQQYRSQDTDRAKVFEMLGVGQSLRGIVDPDATLGQEQMGREGDYGLADDIVDSTVNAAAKWQARWSMQFIKLFYTKPHMRHILGRDGDTLHTRLTQDMVDNGMEVVVSASGVDKMMRKRQATQNMSLGVGDPLSYYQDTEQSNPKQRALMAMMAQGSPQMYITQYLLDDKDKAANPMMQQALAASPGGQAMPPEAQPPMQGAPMGGGNPYINDPLGLFQ